jgi:hypothetical protein
MDGKTAHGSRNTCQLSAVSFQLFTELFLFADGADG